MMEASTPDGARPSNDFSKKIDELIHNQSDVLRHLTSLETKVERMFKELPAISQSNETPSADQSTDDDIPEDNDEAVVPPSMSHDDQTESSRKTLISQKVQSTPNKGNIT